MRHGDGFQFVARQYDVAPVSVIGRSGGTPSSSPDPVKVQNRARSPTGRKIIVLSIPWYFLRNMQVPNRYAPSLVSGTSQALRLSILVY